MIKAIVFDMDGVLIDAREWHYEALNSALNLFGYEISQDDHLELYDGLPTSKKLEMLTSRHGLPRELHSLINRLKQMFTMDIVQTECKPTFNHEYALSRLSREGYAIAVASNSIKSTIQTMMSKSALEGYLQFFLSNEDVDEPKPSPEIYLTAFEKLGLQPKEVLVIEDNDHGVQAAKASGANVMVVKAPTDVTYWEIKSQIEGFDLGLK
jgi:beta-phosphoglucomutase